MIINNSDINVNTISSFNDKPNIKKDIINRIPLNNSNSGWIMPILYKKILELTQKRIVHDHNWYNVILV